MYLKACVVNKDTARLSDDSLPSSRLKRVINLFRSAVAMEVTGSDNDWRCLQFRQKVVAQIEEAMRKAGSGHNKSGTDIENHVFVKAKSREEYLSLVARLIIHYRDIHKKTLGSPNPINALTNLTAVEGGPGAIGMGSCPPGAPVGVMGVMAPMQIGQHAMPGVSGNQQPLGTPAQLSMQQQQQHNLQFQQHQLQVQQQMRAQQQQQQQQQNQMHQSRMEQQMVQLQLHQQQQAQSIQHMVQQQAQPAAFPLKTWPGPMQPLLQQQQQQAAMVPQSLAGQMAPSQHVPINLLSQHQHQLKMQQVFQARAAAVQTQMAAGSGQVSSGLPLGIGHGIIAFHQVSSSAQLVRPNMQIPARMPRPSLAPSIPPHNMAQQVHQHAMMSSPSPMQIQTSQSMLPPHQPSPQPPNSAGSSPPPSLGGFQLSPSPQPPQSPATTKTPQNYGVPSPGSLSTPERKKDLSKMKSLLNILSDPNTRCPLKTMQKSEIASEKLKNDMAVYLCQPLLDAIMANLRSPVFNHSLHRTFGPAMATINGPPITGPSVSLWKRKQEEDERQTVPNILQGEVARLDVKFLVHLDPAHCSNNGAVHLVCKLEDKNLPSVPPLQLSVPADYPDQSPYWADHADQYGANHFLQAVHRTLASKLLQLPDKHSLTEVLHTWAQSVRQACLSCA
ncbi:mediator of RNA polymerase II transcription subunit 15-like isoform X2 [Vanacampus margaritifer]